MFERIVSIDWSGADREDKSVALRIAEWDRPTGTCRIQCPPDRNGRRNWRRAECREFLRGVLAGSQRTLVAMDFGFSLPWGADQAIFGVKGWHAMVRKIAAAYEQVGTARAAAEAINALPQFSGHGPFRFNPSRNDVRFYLDHGIAYYRLTDLAAPQAISLWYLGSGGTVGFHTITGIAALDYLMSLRESKNTDFSVWPFEAMQPGAHVVVESYPAICPKCPQDERCKGDDEHDAWKVLQCLVKANRTGDIEQWFQIPQLRFGRVEGVSYEEQVACEGFMFGLR